MFSNSKQKNIYIISHKGVLIILVLLFSSIFRCTIEHFLIYSGMSTYNKMLAHTHMSYYIWVVYLIFPLPLVLLHRFDYNKVVSLYYKTSFLWLFLYPLVPIVTIFTNSSYRITIPLFKYLPGFMIENNFFPTGMAFIIPLIFFFYIKYSVSIFNISIKKSFLLLFLSTSLVYILFYQYLLRIGYHFHETINFEAFIGVYGLLTSFFLLYPAIVFTSFFTQIKWFFYSLLAFYTLIFTYFILHTVNYF